MPEALDKLSREFRSAVLGGDHDRAARLVSEYTSALRLFWESLPESERAGSLIPLQAQELLTWASGMAGVHRAMAAEQLAIIQKAGRYKPMRDCEASLARRF